MKTVKLFLADPTVQDPEEAPIPVTIVIDEPIPESDYREGLEVWRKFYDEQADALVEALYHALPQGTLDRVALKMFEKKLSLYRGVTNS